MKNNWIWEYIKYDLGVEGWISFYVFEGGGLCSHMWMGVVIFFGVADQIFMTPSPPPPKKRVY